MNLDPSTRRALMTLATLLAAAGNRKFGLDLTPEEVLGIITLTIAYVTSSNWKQAAETKANASASAVVPEQVPAIIARANAEGSKLGPTP